MKRQQGAATIWVVVGVVAAIASLSVIVRGSGVQIAPASGDRAALVAIVQQTADAARACALTYPSGDNGIAGLFPDIPTSAKPGLRSLPGAGSVTSMTTLTAATDVGATLASMTCPGQGNAPLFGPHGLGGTLTAIPSTLKLGYYISTDSGTAYVVARAPTKLFTGLTPDDTDVQSGGYTRAYFRVQ